MKKFLLTTLIATVSLGASTAYANETVTDYSLSFVSSEAVETLRDCMDSDIEMASSKAIRACSKAYKNAVPLEEIRSDILARRGMLQLSAGRFDKASRDFQIAAKLDNQNEMATLGKGYAAMLKKDYALAAKLFEDCKSYHKAAPLATYGLAMTKELTGDIQGAIVTYEKAAQMSPDWQAPREELARVKSNH